MRSSFPDTEQRLGGTFGMWKMLPLKKRLDLRLSRKIGLGQVLRSRSESRWLNAYAPIRVATMLGRGQKYVDEALTGTYADWTTSCVSIRLCIDEGHHCILHLTHVLRHSSV